MESYLYNWPYINEKLALPETKLKRISKFFKLFCPKVLTRVEKSASLCLSCLNNVQFDVKNFLALFLECDYMKVLTFHDLPKTI